MIFEVKKCSKCDNVYIKSTDNFRRHKNIYLRSSCKACEAEYQREWRMKNENKIREHKRKWVKQNEDKYREYQREYQIKNKDRLREYDKEYCIKNRSKIRECQRKWKIKNKGKVLEYKRRYANKNPDKVLFDNTRQKLKREWNVSDPSKELVQQKVELIKVKRLIKQLENVKN